MLVPRLVIRLPEFFQYFLQHVNILLLHWHPYSHGLLVRCSLKYYQHSLAYTIVYFEKQYSLQYIEESLIPNLIPDLVLKIQVNFLPHSINDTHDVQQYCPIHLMPLPENLKSMPKAHHENFHHLQLNHLQQKY